MAAFCLDIGQSLLLRNQAHDRQLLEEPPIAVCCWSGANLDGINVVAVTLVLTRRSREPGRGSPCRSDKDNALLRQVAFMVRVQYAAAGRCPAVHVVCRIPGRPLGLSADDRLS